MIHGHLNSPDTYALLIAHPVWREAFDWLKRIPAKPDLGTYPIRGEEMFARVMEYDTAPREQSTFESHRQFIDLQCTLRGGEVIECRRSEELQPAGPFDFARDLQFYLPAPALTRIHLLPGYFGVFYPADAHLPKIADGEHQSVFKAVIKLGVHLLA